MNDIRSGPIRVVWMHQMLPTDKEGRTNGDDLAVRFDMRRP